MSIIDTLTGINGYTLSILIILLTLIITNKYGSSTVGPIVMLLLGTLIAYFFVCGLDIFRL